MTETVTPLPPTVINADDHAAVVRVESAWWSKINWTQAVGFVCSLITVVFGSKYAVPLEQQGLIVLIIQSLTGLITWVLKTWFTATVTPGSASGGGAVANFPPGVQALISPSVIKDLR